MAATPATLASGGRNPQTAGLQVALRAQGLYRRLDRRDLGAGDRRRDPRLPADGGASGHRSRGRAHARALGPLGRPLFGARHAAPRRVRLGRRRPPVPARPPGDQRPDQRVLRRPDPPRRAPHAAAPPPAQRRRRRPAHVLGARQAGAGAAGARRHRRDYARVASPAPPASRAGGPRRALGRVALVDRAALPHHGREARAAQSPRSVPLPADRDAPEVPHARQVKTHPRRLPHPERRLGSRAARPLGRALRGQRPPRARARVDGVRLQQRARLVGRSTRDHAARCRPRSASPRPS